MWAHAQCTLAIYRQRTSRVVLSAPERIENYSVFAVIVVTRFFFKSSVIMSQESSVPPGPSGSSGPSGSPGPSRSALMGTDFRVLIKESLLEVLQENPQLLQTATAASLQSQRSIGGEPLRVPTVSGCCLVVT